MTTPIYTSAVVFQRPDGAILTARKRGTDRFMLIGGKPEAGETPRQTAVRETFEEIHIVLQPQDLELVGMWRTAAANETGREVHGTVFRCLNHLEELPKPAAEIEEVRWLESLNESPGKLAHLLSTRVLPALNWGSGRTGEIAFATADGHGEPSFEPVGGDGRPARATGGETNEPSPAPAKPWDCDHLPVAEYGAPGSTRNHLTDLIMSGQKVATSSRLSDYDGQELPQVGTLERLCDEAGRLLGVIETEAVEVVALSEVSDDFARAEGEGFADAKQWRRAHEEFWGGQTLPDTELVICERIRFHRAR